MSISQIIKLGIIGLLVAFILNLTSPKLFSTLMPRTFTVRTDIPAPWLIPKTADGSALRIAMVHDVLHERYYRHGPAWFEHRHARVEKELASYADTNKKKDARYFSLLDDFAIDFDRLGTPEKGLPILRQKLDLQQPVDNAGKRGDPEFQFYTTYANLGTLLVHANMKQAIAKDPTAIESVREGLSYIEQAVLVNPDAHFGRERWQMVAIRYLLYVIEKPAALTQFDMAGNAWGNAHYKTLSYNRISLRRIKELVEDGTWDALIKGPRSSDNDSTAFRIRESIPSIRDQDPEWIENFNVESRYYILFDEPTLAFVGIWTLGGGANPHLSLVFAHLMEAMNQRSIAWNAYERTCDLADKFWPDPVIKEKLITHCRERQKILEERIGQKANELRAVHQKELAFGVAEQQAYQTYEAKHIAAGGDPNDEHFYDEFFKNRSPIASDPGFADSYIMEEPHSFLDYFILFQAYVCSIILLRLGYQVIIRHRELAQLD